MSKNEYMRARVIEVISTNQVEMAGQTIDQQQLRLELADGDQIELTHQAVTQDQPAQLQVGEKVILSHTAEPQDHYLIIDYVRTDSILVLLGIFIMAVLAVSRWKGISSLLSMVLSFAVIFVVILPLLIRGMDPVLVSLAGGILIIPPTFYLSHGFNKKSHVAVGCCYFPGSFCFSAR
ncbi:MAG: hypothetical protein GF381_01910 [Candidatus Pacebacteria bacterium]|nr:hypothetical protein [Candidatus Paceibacterota bacterium]